MGVGSKRLRIRSGLGGQEKTKRIAIGGFEGLGVRVQGLRKLVWGGRTSVLLWFLASFKKCACCNVLELERGCGSEYRV